MATEPTPEIGLIDVVQTSADDVAETVRFYRDVLGAVVQRESEEWSRLRLGGVDIGIRKTPATIAGWMPVFRVADIAAVKAALEAAGQPILRDYHDIPGGVMLAFADPAGNAVQIVQLGIAEEQLK